MAKAIFENFGANSRLFEYLVLTKSISDIRIQRHHDNSYKRHFVQ